MLVCLFWTRIRLRAYIFINVCVNYTLYEKSFIYLAKNKNGVRFGINFTLLLI